MQHCPFGYCRYISNKVNVGATENWKVLSYFSCGCESNLAFTYAGLFLHTRGNQDRKSVTSSADPKKKGIAHVGIKLQRLFLEAKQGGIQLDTEVKRLLVSFNQDTTVPLLSACKWKWLQAGFG
jgi:hypothetical protein